MIRLHAERRSPVIDALLSPFHMLRWNPGIEAQAFDRCYRVGQCKPVFIHKLLISHTVEEELYELQQTKIELAYGLLDAERKGRGTQRKDKEDRNLGFKKSTGITMMDLRQIFLGRTGGS
jgi:hypothetical protein